MVVRTPRSAFSTKNDNCDQHQQVQQPEGNRLCAARILGIYPISSFISIDRTERNDFNITFQPSWQGFSGGSVSDDYTTTNAYTYDLPRIVGSCSRFGDASWTLYPQKSQPLMLGQQTMYIQFAIPTNCKKLVLAGEYDYQIKRLGVISGPIWRRYDVVETSLCSADKIQVKALTVNLPDATFQKVAKSPDKASASPPTVKVSRHGSIDYVQAGNRLYGVTQGDDVEVHEIPINNSSSTN